MGDSGRGEIPVPGRLEQAPARVAIDRERYDAVIFDLDGVITDTASVHEAAWRRMFDAYLSARADLPQAARRPFDPDDYRRYVDGKPRYDGVRDFLASRGVDLPWGDPSDGSDVETVCGLGNRKDGYFHEQLTRFGVTAYPGSVRLVRALRAAGFQTAIISASRNCAQVLEAAGVADLFTVRVDGVVADQLGLPGKPDPAVFLEAARRLGVRPERSVVVEDALAGVEAGRRGGFGMVIGVDRTGNPEDLAEHGATVVVADLAEVAVGDGLSETEGSG